jgi:hypothetical protein
MVPKTFPRRARGVSWQTFAYTTCMGKTERALRWIVGILNREKIPFQISGGFAARVYGTARAVADIDIDVSDADVHKLYPLVKEDVIYGPSQYESPVSRILLMTLNYQGQEIDIGGTNNSFMRNGEGGTWVQVRTDFSQGVWKDYEGISVPLCPLQELVAYKRILSRDVDVQDIQELERLYPEFISGSLKT